MELDNLIQKIAKEEEAGNSDYAEELKGLIRFIETRDYAKITFRDFILSIKKEQDALNDRWEDMEDIDILSEYSDYLK